MHLIANNRSYTSDFFPYKSHHSKTMDLSHAASTLAAMATGQPLLPSLLPKKKALSQATEVDGEKDDGEKNSSTPLVSTASKNRKVRASFFIFFH